MSTTLTQGRGVLDVPSQARGPGALRTPCFVLGVFATPASAERMAEALRRDVVPSPDLLVITAPGHEAPAGSPPGAAAPLTIEVDGAALSGPSWDLELAPPFEALPQSLTRAGAQRIRQNIANHLTAGAAVVIARVYTADEQRRTSKAFLDASCKILLTHEAVKE